MKKIEQWHRRHAVHIAAQLPDSTEDGLIILRLATDLVNGFLVQSEKEDRPVVKLVQQERPR